MFRRPDPTDMFRRPDPTDEKNRGDVTVQVVEDLLQHLNLDATISLLHKQIAKKLAVENWEGAPEKGLDVELQTAVVMLEKYMKKKGEREFLAIKHRDIHKQKEVNNQTHQHSTHDLRSQHRRPRRTAPEAKLEETHNTQKFDDAASSSYNYEQLQQCYAALQKEYGTLSKEYMKDMEVWKHRNCQIKATMDKAKQLPPTSSTISESSATLPLLKEAVDRVQVAIATCASRLVALAKRHSLEICTLREYLYICDHQFNSASEMSGLQVALQASFLSDVLFHSFESPSFGGDFGNTESFEKPWRRRQQRLQAFHKLRFLEDRDICMLQQQDAEFNGFMRTKSELIESKLRKVVQPEKTKKKHAADGCDSNREQLTDEFFADLKINKLYKISISRLAKAVWQLHKLAFAFEPSSAEIFRVSPYSVYDEEYMQEGEESMMQAKEWDKMGQYLSEKQVLFMSLPGFTLGKNSIIKSLVFLKHS